MGRAKRTRKFAQVKRIISRRDARLKNNNEKEPGSENRLVRHIPQAPSSLFFQANEALVPPYSVLVDTNFVSHTVRAKLDMRSAMMNLLYSNCTPIFTSCSIAELEKLGDKFKIALRIARDEGFQRLPCSHKGTYADDCIINLVLQHRIYIVATNDRDLKRRLRKIPGVPIMSVAKGKYVIERLPEALPK